MPSQLIMGMALLLTTIGFRDTRLEFMPENLPIHSVTVHTENFFSFNVRKIFAYITVTKYGKSYLVIYFVIHILITSKPLPNPPCTPHTLPLSSGIQ